MFFRASILLSFVIKACLAPVFAETSGGDGVNAASAAAWADETIGGAFEAGQITGAVVNVVKDGAIIFEKGYGYGDVVAKTPASPSTTRVRIGSTTKTFTATIIAQLMEEGLIASINDPVNKYLKRYQLPANDGVEITLRHLLTHTAGFEDKFYFIGTDRPVEVPISAETFDLLRPPYARPAGEKVVYSNFGVATLGLVIEDLTGEPIDRAMEDRIFGPVGMEATDLIVDIGEPQGLAVPGDIDAEGRVTGPTRFTAINPAVAQTGSIVSTARDMARYMNAQLGFNGHLSPAVRENLHRRLEENSPAISGLGMVFFVDDWAGRKTVAHGGNWAGFHTWMTVLPEEGVGFYVTLLSNAKAPGPGERFVSAVFPDRAKPPSPAFFSASSMSNAFLAAFYGPKRAAPNVAASENLQPYAGYYRGDRRPYTTAEELSSLVYFGGGVLKIDARPDGLYLGAAGPWVPVGDGNFVLDAGTRPITVIAPNPRTGKLTLSPEIGIYTFTKIPAWTNPQFHALAIHLFLPLTLIGLLSPIVIGRNVRAAAAFVGGLSGLVMICAAIAGLGEADSMMVGYYGGYLTRIGVFVIGANLMAASVAVSLVQAFMEKRGRWRLLALSAPAFASCFILAQYGALGFRLI